MIAWFIFKIKINIVINGWKCCVCSNMTLLIITLSVRAQPRCRLCLGGTATYLGSPVKEQAWGASWMGGWVPTRAWSPHPALSCASEATEGRGSHGFWGLSVRQGGALERLIHTQGPGELSLSHLWKGDSKKLLERNRKEDWSAKSAKPWLNSSGISIQLNSMQYWKWARWGELFMMSKYIYITLKWIEQVLLQ